MPQPGFTAEQAARCVPAIQRVIERRVSRWPAGAELRPCDELHETAAQVVSEVLFGFPMPRRRAAAGGGRLMRVCDSGPLTGPGT